MKRSILLLSSLFCIAAIAAAGAVLACPFCSAPSLTLTQEIQSSDVVVLAKLVKAPSALKQVDGAPLITDDNSGRTKFEIVEVLKGKKFAEPGRFIETIYFGEGSKELTYLITGVEPPVISWSTPMALGEDGREYVTRLPKIMEKEPVEQLAFFLDYLEHEDERLAQDAYDEFARAPFEVVKELKEEMDHGRLVSWIQDPVIPASRRSLYFTLLGVCGKPEDLPMLEKILRSDDRQQKAGLNAAINCYIMIKGPEGLELVEDLFLKNKDADYTDTYSAVVAIRVHGQEVQSIPTERLVKSLRHMLDRPELADLVIHDLSRWEDWESTERLVELFKEADGDSSWVRAPVIQFLQASPEPRAQEYLAELAKIDPKAVERANIFSGGFPADAPPPSDPEAAEDPAKPTEAASASSPDEASPPAIDSTEQTSDREVAAQPPAQLAETGDLEKEPATTPEDSDSSNNTERSTAQTVVDANPGSSDGVLDGETTASAPLTETSSSRVLGESPSIAVTWLVAIPVLSIVVLMALIWIILRSAGRGVSA